MVAFDVETRLSELLQEVQRGRIVTITQRGVPVAVLAPPDTLRPVSDVQDDEEWLDQAIVAWRRYRDERQRRRTSLPSRCPM
jgi:antitoxin (DNA-binding transcriptional repressor) of toxin-antitoxin stability system